MAVGAGLVAAGALASALSIWQLCDLAVESARASARERAIAVAAHAAQVFAAADFVLQGVVDLVLEAGLEPGPDLRHRFGTKETFRLLKARTQSFQAVDVVGLVDADGRLVNFSRRYPPPDLRIEDREAFRVASASVAGETYVTRPVRSRATGQVSFYLARRLEARSGQSIGVALVGLSPRYFSDFYRSLAPPRTGSAEGDASISLLHQDLTVMARTPQNGEAVGRRIRAAGVYRDLRASEHALPLSSVGPNTCLGRPSPRTGTPRCWKPVRWTATRCASTWCCAKAPISRPGTGRRRPSPRCRPPACCSSRPLSPCWCGC